LTAASHQFAQTKFVERSDGGQVVPPEAIVNYAQSRHDDAWAVAIASLHDRQPEIHMLVVPSRKVKNGKNPAMERVKDAFGLKRRPLSATDIEQPCRKDGS
jgi:hypothetical protein